MKFTPFLLLCASLVLTPTTVSAQSWLDTVKATLGFGQQQEQETPSVEGMLSQLTANLPVESNQAQGGLGALLQYAQTNLSNDQFSQLGDMLPGLSDVLGAAPSVEEAKQSGLGGLLNKAVEQNETLKQLNVLRLQFEELGLSPQMIGQFVNQITRYLDTEQGQQALSLLKNGFSGLG